VLNAKGGEIKAKATGSATACDFLQKLLCQSFDQNPLIGKLISCQGENWLWEKGELLTLDPN
jgi:hypothetical protein